MLERELDSEGLGPHKMSLFLLWAVSIFLFVLKAHEGGLKREPRGEMLSGLGVPLLICIMLIVTGISLQPKKQPL